MVEEEHNQLVCKVNLSGGNGSNSLCLPDIPPIRLGHRRKLKHCTLFCKGTLQHAEQSTACQQR